MRASREPARVLARSPIRSNNFLWVPTDSQSYVDWRYVEERFGVEGHVLVLYARAKSGNIFDFDGMTQLLNAHRFTVNLQTNVMNKTVKFTDACKRLPEFDDEGYESNKMCYTPSFLSLWNFEQNTLVGSLAKSSILDRMTQLHAISPIESFAANVVFEEQDDNTKKVVSAEAVMLVYQLRSTDGASYEIQPAWLDGIAGSVDHTVLEVSRYSTRAFDDEVGRLVSGDIPLFAIGMFIISFFVALTLGPITSLYRSRVLLGVMAIVNVLLATGAGFGLASAFGVKFPSIAALLPLILLGVQVDSVIILVDNLNAEPSSDPLEMRMGNSLAKSGPAILVTALTTISAFSTSTATPSARALDASNAEVRWSWTCLSVRVMIVVAMLAFVSHPRTDYSAPPDAPALLQPLYLCSAGDRDVLELCGAVVYNRAARCLYIFSAAPGARRAPSPGEARVLCTVQYCMQHRR